MNRKPLPPVSPRFRRVLKILACCALALVVLGVAVWLALPPLARWAIQTQGSEALGRRITVGEVQFDPLSLVVRVADLQIAEADGSTPWVRLARAEADISSASLWHRSLVLEALRLEAPEVGITRLAAGRFNFSDILERFAKQPDEPASEPFRFSINNIELSGGSVRFDDQPEARVHTVEGIRLGVPFISNLPTRADIHVQPLLEATINGSPFHLRGEAVLFAEHREATLDLGFDALNLSDYQAYLPDNLPVRIEGAKISSGLHLAWVEAVGDKPASLVLSGKLAIADARLRDAQGGALLAFDALEADIARLEPLAVPFAAEITALRLKAPVLELARDRDGQLNVQKLAARPAAPAAQPAPAPVTRSAPAAAASAPAAAPPPQVRIARVELSDGRLDWKDAAVPGGFAASLKALGATLEGFDLAGDKPARMTLKADGGELGQLAAEASVGLRQGRYTGQLSLARSTVERLAPYYQDALGRMRLAGRVSGSTAFTFEPGKPGAGMLLERIELDLQSLALAEKGGKAEPIRVAQATLSGGRVELATHTLQLGRIAVRGAALGLVRDATGRFTVPGLLLAAPPEPAPPAAAQASSRAAASSSAPAPAAAPASAAPAWRIALDEAHLSASGLNFVDASGTAPVSVNLADVDVKFSKWNNQPGTQAQLAVKSRVNRAGEIAVDGSLATTPLKAMLRVNLKAVDILAVQPYVDDLYRVLINRGRLSANGRLLLDMSQPGTPDVRYAGTLAVDGFNAMDRLNETDFMRWRHFSTDALQFRTRPLTITTRTVTLEDFFTRLILDEQGRLNVRELGAEEAGATPATAAGETAAAAAAAVAEVATEASRSGPGPVVSVERVQLSKGNVVFSDRFVKPNYEARLMDLSGSISGLSSDPSQLATLALKASMDGAAPVNVEGSFNPFRHDQTLDIQAQVRDVDLTSASTYAARYVGYGIEKGKLSMEVQYRIRERQLTASNRVRLDQLTFGDRVDSPTATKLPVLLAVSLLKDRNGVIDVNLPVSGSLDDPQFSIGRVVVRVLTNLIGRAVTAPFALLGSAIGRGGDAEQLSFVDFAAGSAQIDPKALQKLGELAKALSDRPALSLEIAGKADPAADASGLKRARLDAQIRALYVQKVGRRTARGNDVPAAEYPALLKSVYSEAKIDARPRNVIGLLKDQPVPEMERMLLASYVITPEDLEALARARAQAIREWLLETGQVASARVFLMNSANAVESRDGKSAQARVEFSLR
ncbi:MAG: DUF748 domain-containing protein [Candidatus Dactylopiibacterium sp.]|nr:DUF748 domain-containing protein [Candidatus Dactylopiibacterium sp.]